jgi:dienelactone hydrolase
MIRQQHIKYSCDGTVLSGYLAEAAASDKPAPAILLAHEAPGMSQLMRDRADALARLGYVAFALDLHGATGFDQDEARRRHLELMETPSLIHDRAHAALDLLADQPSVDATRIGAVGFCQGGITVMELARSRAPVRCVIGFHPGLRRPAGSATGPITARILMMVGDDDPLVPPDDRSNFVAEMKAAQAHWEMHVFGGVAHAFTNPAVDELGLSGFRYNERATRRSWEMMLCLLEETLAP